MLKFKYASMFLINATDGHADVPIAMHEAWDLRHLTCRVSHFRPVFIFYDVFRKRLKKNLEFCRAYVLKKRPDRFVGNNLS